MKIVKEQRIVEAGSFTGTLHGAGFYQVLENAWKAGAFNLSGLTIHMKTGSGPKTTNIEILDIKRVKFAMHTLMVMGGGSPATIAEVDFVGAPVIEFSVTAALGNLVVFDPTRKWWYKFYGDFVALKAELAKVAELKEI